MHEDVSKHLEFIQGVITRMAGNSFVVKGWSITIAVALFALAARDCNPVFAILAVFPGMSFWGLDAYYLRQERLFRRLYDDVRRSPGDANHTVDRFSLSIDKYKSEVSGWFYTLWCLPVIGLHGVVLAGVLVVFTVLAWTQY